jgi:hypothetical protein
MRHWVCTPPSFVICQLEHVATRLALENKVLLFLIWLIGYPDFSLLVLLFGVSLPVISHFICFAIPHFVGFFGKYIPNHFLKKATTSHLSRHIIGIIDGTVHPICKLATDQHLWWNDHYQFHAVHSLFLVDYERRIIGVETGIPGSFHDSSAANNAKFFEKLVKDKFVLGDPGFQGVGYVIAGFKSNQLPTPAQSI